MVKFLFGVIFLLTTIYRQGWRKVLRRYQGTRSDHMPHTHKDPSSDVPQGKVYDVTGNKMYQPGNSYNGKWEVFILNLTGAISSSKSTFGSRFLGCSFLNVDPATVSPGNDAPEFAEC